MATINCKRLLSILAFVVASAGIAHAADENRVSSAIVNSDQTVIVNDQGESVQEYGVGQLIYVIVDSKLGNDKKHRDFYRVTFDPTNTTGDGWVQKDKVKLMTSYHSIDGKEPKEYERKAVDVASAPKSSSASSTSGAGLGTSDASSFLDELVKKDSAKPELKSVAAQPKAAEPKKGEKNPLENDLEFLFKQDGEFKNTMKQAKASVKSAMTKNVGISDFSASSDAFTKSVMDQFTAKLQKDSGQTMTHVPFAASLEDPTVMKVDNALDGVFFGQISPKIGEARLLKIKYYDRVLKQFTFEKVAKIPLNNSTKTIETLANDCYQFVSK